MEVPSTVQGLLVLLMLVIPGYLARMVFGAVVTIPQKDHKQILLDSVAWSVFMAPLLVLGLYVEARLMTGSDVALFIVVAAWTVVSFSSLAGLVVGRVCKQRPAVVQRMGLRPLVPKAWDERLGRGEPLLVLATLTDGSRLGGLWGGNSFASSYPADEDIYVEQAWELEPESGRFIRPAQRTAGFWVSAKSIRYLEFWTVETAPKTDRGGQ